MRQNLTIGTDPETGKKTYTISFPGAKALRQKLLNGTAARGLGAIPAEQIYIQESYTITEDELKEAAKKAGAKYSAGDKDILLMEVAYEKFRKDAYRTRAKNQIPNTTSIQGLERINAESVLQGDYLSGGNPADVTYLITGNEPRVYYDKEKFQSAPTLYVDSDYQMHLTDEAGNIMKQTKAISTGQQEILRMLEEDSKDGKLDNFAATASFKVTSQEVNGQIIAGGGHALTITKVDKDYVYLANPWYPEQEIKMTKQDFVASCFSMNATPLNKEGTNAAQNNPTPSTTGGAAVDNNPNPNQPSQSNRPNYTVPKGKSYTEMIKEALQQQGIKVTPENIQKAKEQFEQANPEGTVKIYNGKNQSWHGNKFLYANAQVFIPQFVIFRKVD